MWPYVSLGIGLWAIVSTLLWRSAKKGRAKEHEKKVEWREAAKQALIRIRGLQGEIANLERHANEILEAKRSEMQGCFNTITTAINATDGDAQLAIVNADVARLLDVPWSTPTRLHHEGEAVPAADSSRAETVDGNQRVRGRDALPDDG